MIIILIQIKKCIGELMGNGGKYYLEDDLNKLVKSDTSLLLLHVNARSLNKNLDILTLYLDTLHHSFSVIAISETWARDDNDVFLQISGYTFVTSKINDRDGGVALYVRSNISYIRREDLCKTDRECYESVFNEIINVKKCKIIVGCIYRPPGQDVRKFNDQCEVLI